ncbi:MAG: hypothetical protein H8D80_01590 [Proteobacteria bacterium]|nr:hypothetical protein [Pseudomonadota bacterium]
MIIEKNTVIRASKDILARCMATEDIRVIHDKNSETAYFDTKNRVLCLPIWQDMSNSMYDMLVGHEVSHALHTPAEGWQEFVGKGKGSQMRHMFINVVEDARIERMIKDKFPGLRRDFSNAYQEFANRDLFELKNRTIDTNMPLIDRLNLHFKIGLFGIETIPFLANEQQYVTRMQNAETFDEVVQLAKELYEMQVEQDAEQDENGDSQGESNESGEGEESEAQGSNGQSNDDAGDSQDGSQSGSDSEDGDEDGQNSGDAEGDESGDDSQSNSDGSQDGDSDGSQDGDSDDSQDGDSQNDSQDAEQSGLEYDDYTEKGNAGSTQHNYEKNIGNLRDESSKEFEYHTLPTMKIENCVIDYKQVRSIWESFEKEKHTSGDDYLTYYNEQKSESVQTCTEFLSRTKSTVQNMVQQFQMKQAADADKRTSVAKTGVLDSVNMINYRWSEDIFLKNEVHADGKNHGIIMYLDWSGSMNGILQDTIEQLLILTEFCQKINIPFDVYAFSSRRINRNGELQHIADDNDRTILRPHSFSLIQFLSSCMKTNEYKKAVQELYYLGWQQKRWTRQETFPSCFNTGCTPLNEAVVSAIQMVPAFQAKHNVQIVNTVFLTDGDGHSMGARDYYSKSYVHDPKTKKDYLVNDCCTGGEETATYLQILRERTGANIIGIRLHDNKNIKTLKYRYFRSESIEDHIEAWKKLNFTSIITDGYDKLFIVRGNLHVATDVLDKVSHDASYSKLKNAFMKGANNAKGSRVIASQIIDIIAK